MNGLNHAVKEYAKMEYLAKDIYCLIVCLWMLRCIFQTPKVAANVVEKNPSFRMQKPVLLSPEKAADRGFGYGDPRYD